MKKRKLLVIFHHDSFIKAGLVVGKYFEEQGYFVDYYVRQLRVKQEQIESFGLKNYKFGSIKNIFTIYNTNEYDSIFIYLQGPQLREVYNEFYKKYYNKSKRPIFFTGYVGVVYEKIINGFYDRISFDTFFINSQKDFDYFKMICKNEGIDDSSLLLSGLPKFDNIKCRDIQNSNEVILFAAQPTVPKKYEEMYYIVYQLILYAQNNSDDKVILKPRIKKGEHTVHPPKYFYEDILIDVKKVIDIPNNFQISYNDIYDLYEQSTTVVSVSSTALIEAMILKKKILVLSDFGIFEDYGNYYFLGSGCVGDFSILHNNQVSYVNKKWFNKHITLNDNTATLFNRIDYQVNIPRKPMKNIRYEMTLMYENFINKGFIQANALNKTKNTTIYLLKRIIKKIIKKLR